MIVQWAMKGMHLDDDREAERILWPRGLVCNWGREAGGGGVPIDDISKRLTPRSIDMHVNHFSDIDPQTRRKYYLESPYISLSCGAVQRDEFARTNYVYRALRTALQFGFNFGGEATAYVFVCWVLVAPRAAAEIQGVAEEVRDLTVYRRYSAYQDQGEVAAKLHVPANQISRCEKWTWDRGARTLRREWTKRNDERFVPPERLSNVRALL